LKSATQIVNNYTSGELSYALCFSNQTDQGDGDGGFGDGGIRDGEIGDGKIEEGGCK
jgi:hypothetical protein